MFGRFTYADCWCCLVTKYMRQHLLSPPLVTHKHKDDKNFCILQHSFQPQIWQIRTGWYFMMMMVRRSARNIQKCIHYQRLQRASWDVGWSICGLKLVMCRLFILDLATQLTLLLQLDLSHWNTNTWYLRTKLHQDSEGTFYRCHRLAI